MPHPIAINVTVASTPTLRGNYVGQSQRREHSFFTNMNPVCGSQSQPLVVVRGCSPIQLQAATNATAQLQWYSEHIKNTYVVLAKMHWKLNVKSVVQTNVDSNTPFGVTCMCTPQTGSGTSRVNEEILQLPLEASAAGIETYGPTAVSGGEDSSDDDETDYAKYLWQQT